MTTREISEKIKRKFNDAISETTNGLLHGASEDQVIRKSEAKQLIAEAFVDGVLAASLGDGGHAKYFKND
jgi:hypothetical protein